MKRFVGFCLVLALGFAVTLPLLAQDTAKQEERLRYRGTITVMDKQAKTFTIQLQRSAATKVPVFYTDKTVFTTLNKPGASADDLKEGRQVIVLYDPETKGKVVATRVDFRTEVSK